MEWHCDKEKLIQAMVDFRNVAGINIGIYDGDYHDLAGSQIAAARYANPYCKRIQALPGGLQKCQQCDKALLQLCGRTGSRQWQICHAGLTDAAVPIVQDGLTVGYVILGQLKRNTSRFPFSPQHPDYPALRQTWEALPTIEDRVFESAVSLALMVASYIMTQNLLLPDTRELAAAVGGYLAAHLTEQPTVAALCARFHTSKNTLYREFRQRYGCTVAAYLLQRRVEAAKELLQRTEKTVVAVGEEVGFGSYCNFCRFFKRQTGLTPSAYRLAQSRQASLWKPAPAGEPNSPAPSAVALPKAGSGEPEPTR